MVSFLSFHSVRYKIEVLLRQATGSKFSRVTCYP